MNQHKADFERIFRSTNRSLYGYIKKFVDNEHDAADIMQQCYIRLWLNIEEVDDLDNVLYLLFTYSRNMVIDSIRRRAVEKKNMREYAYLLKDVTEMDRPDEDQHTWGKMKNALMKLPERKRAIFLLRQQQGLSTREIAERFNITQRSVRRHLEDAVLMMRDHLSSTELLSLIVLNASAVHLMMKDLPGAG